MPISRVAMTSYQLPDAQALVEMTIDGEPRSGVRVVRSTDDVVTLSLALDGVPDSGAAVTLRWPAGPRGRFALPGTVVQVDGNRVDIRAAGELQVEQQRNYVRGGGGEHVLLLQRDRGDTLGWVRDISEQGVRAHFADVELAEGDEVGMRVQLEHDIVEIRATVVKVGTLRQMIPRRGPMSVEVVAVYTPDESQATKIRRYVFRQQLLARSPTIS
jgi:hypothetical protein